MARYAPGLPIDELRRLTPEESKFVRREVEDLLDVEAKVRLEHTKAIARAAARTF